MQWVKDGMPLPRHGASKRVEHHPAISFEDIPAFIAELRKRNSVSARALEFTVLTAARTSDTIDARWREIEGGVWRISDGRHKTSKDFEIPLSTRAVEILDAIPHEPGGYVFPGAKAKSPLSNMAMSECLKGMHSARATAGLPPWVDKTSGRLAVVHGFRSSFRDWSGDRTNFARDSHRSGDELARSKTVPKPLTDAALR